MNKRVEVEALLEAIEGMDGIIPWRERKADLRALLRAGARMASAIAFDPPKLQVEDQVRAALAWDKAVKALVWESK